MGLESTKRAAGRKYRFNFTVNYNRYSSPWFNTKKEAELWAAEKRMAVEANEVIQGSEILVENFCDLWLERHSFVNKVKSAAIKDEQYLRLYVKPRVGGQKLRKVSELQWEFLIADLRSEGRLAPKTINNFLGTLKRMLNDAVRWKYLNKNPIKHLRPAKISTQQVTYLYPEEVEKLLNYTKENCPVEHSLFVFALNTGCRLGECLSLDWAKVDLIRRAAVIDSTFDWTIKKPVSRTKGRRFRQVPLNSKVINVLQFQEAKKGLVWPHIDYGYFTGRRCRRIFQNSGLEAALQRGASFHCLRHTFASKFMQNGGQIYVLQQILGHSTVTQTEKYSHFSPNSLTGTTEGL